MRCVGSRPGQCSAAAPDRPTPDRSGRRPMARGAVTAHAASPSSHGAPQPARNRACRLRVQSHPPTRCSAGRSRAPACQPRSPARWPTPPHLPTVPTRRQALHLRLGRGHRRRQRHDEGPARRQGRGPRRDDARRPADAARLHDHDRGLQRLLRERQAAAGGPLGRRPRGDAGGRAADRQGLRRRGEPAARLGPLGRQVLDARDDGHGPQPRPQRGDARRASSPCRATSASAGTPTAGSSACSAGSSWT